jgi:hypothetical protein
MNIFEAERSSGFVTEEFGCLLTVSSFLKSARRSPRQLGIGFRNVRRRIVAYKTPCVWYYGSYTSHLRALSVFSKTSLITGRSLQHV